MFCLFIPFWDLWAVGEVPLENYCQYTLRQKTHRSRSRFCPHLARKKKNQERCGAEGGTLSTESWWKIRLCHLPAPWPWPSNLYFCCHLDVGCSQRFMCWRPGSRYNDLESARTFKRLGPHSARWQAVESATYRDNESSAKALLVTDRWVVTT